jgi:hypothetical protein
MAAISAPQGCSDRRGPLHGHLRRALGLDHNPLCRKVDRARSRLLLLMAAALATAALVAALIGQAVLHGEQTAARQLAGHRHQVVATTVSGVAEDGVPGDGGTVAQAVWHFPQAVSQSGPVPVPPGTTSGTTVSVWVDDGGRPAAAPQSTTDQVTHAAVAGLGSFAGLVLTAQVLYAVRSRSLDKHADREWEPDWELVEPVWSGRMRRRPDDDEPA